MGVVREFPWRATASAGKDIALRFSTGLALVLSAVFIAGSVFVIYSQAIYSPYWDHWDWLRRYFSSSETFRSLSLTPINGHVVFVPSLLYRVDIALFGGANVLNLSAMLA